MNEKIGLTLAEAAPDLHRLCHDRWAVIGSAAVSLVGAVVSVADIDVLTSVEDADRLASCWRSRSEDNYTPAGAERFRSRFGRFRFSGLPLEVMGGLELFDQGAWQAVQIGERMFVSCGPVQIPVPAIADQIRILECFARPKDLQRAALLRALA
ncbi:MAG TPA: hypothetical protein VIM98_09130 [Dyella sp.]|uniref:hypothetical protein n=1 Tax=Dyella sp. TaxID=1869338 RepID=UPI002F92D95F